MLLLRNSHNSVHQYLSASTIRLHLKIYEWTYCNFLLGWAIGLYLGWFSMFLEVLVCKIVLKTCPRNSQDKSRSRPFCSNCRDKIHGYFDSFPTVVLNMSLCEVVYWLAFESQSPALLRYLRTCPSLCLRCWLSLRWVKGQGLALLMDDQQHESSCSFEGAEWLTNWRLGNWAILRTNMRRRDATQNNSQIITFIPGLCWSWWAHENSLDDHCPY